MTTWTSLLKAYLGLLRAERAPAPGRGLEPQPPRLRGRAPPAGREAALL